MSDPAFLEMCHRWLLFHYHCNDCSQSEDSCEYGKTCAMGKSTFVHVRTCTREDCTVPRCDLIKNILRHHSTCKDEGCEVCAPVRKYQARSRASPPQHTQTASPPGGGQQQAHVDSPQRCSSGCSLHSDQHEHQHYAQQVQQAQQQQKAMQQAQQQQVVMQQAQQQQQVMQQAPSPMQGQEQHNMEETPSTPLTELLAGILTSDPLPFLPPMPPQPLQQQLQLQRTQGQGGQEHRGSLFGGQQQQQQQPPGRPMGMLFEARHREHKRASPADVSMTAAVGRSSLSGVPTHSTSAGSGGSLASAPSGSQAALAELQALHLDQNQGPGPGSPQLQGQAQAQGQQQHQAQQLSMPMAMQMPQHQQQPQQQQQQQQQRQQQQQQQQQQATTMVGMQQQEASPGATSAPAAAASILSSPYHRASMSSLTHSHTLAQPHTGMVMFSNGVMAHAVPSQPLMVAMPHLQSHPLHQHLVQGAAAGGPAGSTAAATAQPGMVGAPMQYTVTPAGAPSGFAVAGAPGMPGGGAPQYMTIPYGTFTQMSQQQHAHHHHQMPQHAHHQPQPMQGMTYTIVHHPHHLGFTPGGHPMQPHQQQQGVPGAPLPPSGTAGPISAPTGYYMGMPHMAQAAMPMQMGCGPSAGVGGTPGWAMMQQQGPLLQAHTVAPHFAAPMPAGALGPLPLAPQMAGAT